jgi:hypothetical protein
MPIVTSEELRALRDRDADTDHHMHQPPGIPPGQWPRPGGEGHHPEYEVAPPSSQARDDPNAHTGLAAMGVLKRAWDYPFLLQEFLRDPVGALTRPRFPEDPARQKAAWELIAGLLATDEAPANASEAAKAEGVVNNELFNQLTPVWDLPADKRFGTLKEILLPEAGPGQERWSDDKVVYAMMRRLQNRMFNRWHDCKKFIR